MLACSNCGTSVGKTVNYCPECGAKISKAQSSTQGKGTQQSPVDDAEKSGRSWSTPAAIGIIVGCTALLAFIGLLGGLPDDQEPSTSTVEPDSPEYAKQYEAFKKENPLPPKIRVSQRYASSDVNVRSGPSTSTEVVDTYSRGQTVWIVPDSSTYQWTAVTFSQGARAIYGYVSSDYLRDTPVYQRDTPVPPIEIVDWNWRKDPGFGSNGAVRYTVELRNNTERYIRQVRVDFTTYDAAGSVIMSDYTYVTGLSPGGVASESSFADYFGEEKRARIRVNPSSF